MAIEQVGTGGATAVHDLALTHGFGQLDPHGHLLVARAPCLVETQWLDVDADDDAIDLVGHLRGTEKSCAVSASVRDHGQVHDLDGSYCLMPDQLSPSARRLRQQWSDRWAAADPSVLPPVPAGAVESHGHAYPSFRDPLKRSDWNLATADFLRAAVARIARGHVVTVVSHVYTLGAQALPPEPRNLHGELDRWLTVVAPDDDPDHDDLVTHFFRTRMRSDDARLLSALAETPVWSDSSYRIAAIAHDDHQWLAYPREECLHLITHDPELLDDLATAETETWGRWNIPMVRYPHIDLAAVDCLVRSRREAWTRHGVEITSMRYRTWADGAQYDAIRGEGRVTDFVEHLPERLDRTDWLHFTLESDPAHATVLIHDTGACRIDLDTGEDACECPPTCHYCHEVPPSTSSSRSGVDCVCLTRDLTEEPPPLFAERDPDQPLDLAELGRLLERAVAVLVSGSIEERSG